jgi:hypothetical protein
VLKATEAPMRRRIVDPERKKTRIAGGDML